jgi:hypothetical protein
MSQLSWDVFVAPELALAGDDLPPGLSTRTWGPVSATLIMGREDAVLVDALLTTAQATALVDPGPRPEPDHGLRDARAR